MPIRPTQNFRSNLKTQHLIKTANGIIILGRHSDRSDASASGLSELGHRRLTWSAKHLPENMVLHTRHATGKKRHMNTAKELHQNYPGEKGTLKETNSLNVDTFVKDSDTFNKMYAEIGDPKLTHMWMAGKIPTNIIDPPLKVGRQVLADILSQYAESKISGKRNLLVAITSAGVEGAVLKTLGLDYLKISPKKPRANDKPRKGDILQYAEGILFFIGPNNELVLKYRGRPFIITKQGNKLVAKKG